MHDAAAFAHAAGRDDDIRLPANAEFAAFGGVADLVDAAAVEEV
jgi:hypothetical protein